MAFIDGESIDKCIYLFIYFKYYLLLIIKKTKITICRRIIRRQLSSVDISPSIYVIASQGIADLTFLDGHLIKADGRLSLPTARLSFADGSRRRRYPVLQ